MNIWEERYYNQELDMLESPQTFQIFQVFLELSLPRNLKKLTHAIYFPNEIYNQSLTQSKPFKTKYNIIKIHSHRYKWFMRAEAYDNYYLKQYKLNLQKQKFEFLMSIAENTKVRVALFDKQSKEDLEIETEEVVAGDGLKKRKRRQSEKAHTQLELQQARSNALDDAIKLFNGGDTTSYNINENLNTHEFNNGVTSLCSSLLSYRKPSDKEFDEDFNKA